MRIFHNKKKIDIPVRKVSSFGKFSGFMFKTKDTENLLFEFSKKTGMRIHSFFVFFPFLAVWLDEKDRVIDSKIVKPFTLSVKPKKQFKKLIEISLNSKNKKIIDFFNKN